MGLKSTSSHLQQAFVKYTGKKTIPTSVQQAIAKLDPAVGKALKYGNINIHAGYRKRLSQMMADQFFSKKHGLKTAGQTAYHIEHEMEDAMKKFRKEKEAEINQLKEEKREKKEAYRQQIKAKRLEEIKNPTRSREIAEALRKSLIKQARNKSTRLENARQYVEKLVADRRKSKTNTSTQPTQHTPPSSPFKPPDLAV